MVHWSESIAFPPLHDSQHPLAPDVRNFSSDQMNAKKLRQFNNDSNDDIKIVTVIVD